MIPTFLNLDEAKKFFLKNSSGSCMCVKGNEQKECYSFPEAQEFFEKADKYHEPDSDFGYALQAIASAPFSQKDLKGVLATIPGEANGPSWHWIIELKNGEFYYVTGWLGMSGCVPILGGDVILANTPEEAAQFASNGYDRKEVKEQLLKQLKGEQAYGLYIEPPTS